MRTSVWFIGLGSLLSALSCGPAGPEHVVLGAADIEKEGTHFVAGSHAVVHRACVEALDGLSLHPVQVSESEIVSDHRAYVSERPRFRYGYTLRLRDVPGGVEVEATPQLFDGAADISSQPVWDRSDQRSEWHRLFAEIERMAVIYRRVEAEKGTPTAGRPTLSVEPSPSSTSEREPATRPEAGREAQSPEPMTPEPSPKPPRSCDGRAALRKLLADRECKATKKGFVCDQAHCTVATRPGYLPWLSCDGERDIICQEGSCSPSDTLCMCPLECPEPTPHADAKRTR